MQIDYELTKKDYIDYNLCQFKNIEKENEFATILKEKILNKSKAGV